MQHGAKLFLSPVAPVPSRMHPQVHPSNAAGHGSLHHCSQCGESCAAQHRDQPTVATVSVHAVERAHRVCGRRMLCWRRRCSAAACHVFLRTCTNIVCVCVCVHVCLCAQTASDMLFLPFAPQSIVPLVRAGYVTYYASQMSAPVLQEISCDGISILQPPRGRHRTFFLDACYCSSHAHTMPLRATTSLHVQRCAGGARGMRGGCVPPNRSVASSLRLHGTWAGA